MLFPIYWNQMFNGCAVRFFGWGQRGGQLAEVPIKFNKVEELEIAEGLLVVAGGG